MDRLDQRRLTLVVVLVAMLGILAVVVADGWAARATSAAGAVHGAAAPSDDVPGTTSTAETSMGVHTAGADAQGVPPEPRPAERAGFVQVAADHARTVAQAAPVLLVLAALLVWVAGGRSVVATVVTVVARRPSRAHVRRRGPPALAVV